MGLKNAIRDALVIRPEDNVPPQVASVFKHNLIVNFIDNALFLMGDSFSSVATILPVFVSTLTESPIVLGLIPAILNGAWFLPQLFMAGRIQRTPDKFALTKRLAILERIPYLFFPLMALAIGRISTAVLLWIFLGLIIWRGVASGVTALPWQVIIAKVIPMSHRSRYFGAARLAGQVLGVLGSIAAAFILDRVAYPVNYALCFLLSLVIIATSYLFFIRTKIPEANTLESDNSIEDLTHENSRSIYKQILKEDKNFRIYLVARSLLFLGGMGSGFLAVYGIEKFNLPQSQAGIFTGLIFFSGILGYAFWGIFGDRIGPKKIIIIASIIWSVMLLIVILVPTYWLYYLVFLLFGLATSGFILGDLILVMELGPEDKQAAYLGLGHSLPGLFLLVAPILAGLIVSKTTYPFMFSLSIGFNLLATLIYLKLRDRTRVNLRS